MKRPTIEQLKKGEAFITRANSSIDEINTLIEKFIGRCPKVLDNLKYYTINPAQDGFNCYDMISENTPTAPAKYYLNLLEEKKEKILPRVMLVSDDNNINTANERVVFMFKNNLAITWSNVSTIKESESIHTTNYWKYWWELEEKKSIFPFQLSPVDAKKIIDVACPPWKEKLVNAWAVFIVLEENILVSKEEYDQMIKACTKEQKELFDTIFK